MRDEVGAFEEEIDVIGGVAFHAVSGGDPSGVFWRGPVQLGDDGAAELEDCRSDGLVDILPLEGGVVFFVVVVFGIRGERGREYAAVAVVERGGSSFGRKDYPVGAEVGDEWRAERYQAGFGGHGAISREI